MKKIRHGIIGFSVGQWHAEEFEKVPEIEVTAVADISPDLLRMAKDKGIKKLYSNYQELCQDPDIDSVSVCLPNFLHAPAVIKALEAGKHVLCEKPLAHNLEDGKRIAEAAGKSDKLVMLAMKFRFLPETAFIVDKFRKGEFGDIYYSYTTYLCPLGGIPNKPSFICRKNSGGGSMIDNGVHFLDLQWHLMGHPKPVHALGMTCAKFGPSLSKDFDVDDFAAGMIRFSNGSTAVLENAWACMTQKGTFGLRYLGTKAGATIWPFSVSEGRDGKVEDITPDLAGYKHVSQFQHFADCILKGVKCISPIEEGLELLKMLDALYSSSKQGKGVDIP